MSFGGRGGFFGGFVDGSGEPIQCSVDVGAVFAIERFKGLILQRFLV